MPLWHIYIAEIQVKKIEESLMSFYKTSSMVLFQHVKCYQLNLFDYPVKDIWRNKLVHFHFTTTCVKELLYLDMFPKQFCKVQFCRFLDKLKGTLYSVEQPFWSWCLAVPLDCISMWVLCVHDWMGMLDAVIQHIWRASSWQSVITHRDFNTCVSLLSSKRNLN